MGSLVEESINKLIRNSIDLIIGLEGFAIKANQNAPSPSGDYATVNTTSISGIGWDESRLTNNESGEDLDQTIIGQRNILMTINTYRGQAKDNAESISMGLVRQSIMTLFDSVNVGLGERSDVTGATQALEQGMESRATFSITLNTVVSDSDLVRAINSVDISGEYQARGISTNINIEV